MEALIIVTLVISISCLIGLIALIFVTVKRLNSNGASNAAPLDLKEIGALSNQLENLSKEMKNSIALSMKDEMLNFNKNSNENLSAFETKVTDSLNKRFDSITEQNSKNSEGNNEKLERFQKNITESLNTRFDSLNKQVDDKLTEINKKVDEKLAEGFKGTNESMAQVRERLQAIDDAQKNMEGLSKDVISLKQVLEGNQSRGQYGELQLGLVLHNIFGDTEGLYKEQYTMHKVKDGDDVRADAVVFLPEPNKMICIDSKFPFQDYSKMFDAKSEEEKSQYTKEFSNAIKKHITAIKEKYIVDGKTAPEAIMFIPNDGVFAFIHHNCLDVVEDARKRKVVITSPSTLPPILATINMVRIQTERAKNVEVISKQLHKLSKDFEMFGREWEQFSNALESTSKKRELLDSRVGKLTTKFDSLKASDNLEIEEKEILEISNDN